MLDILMRAGSFIAFIVMGFLLKKIGFFKQSDFTLLSRIALRITLPCAIILSFAGKTIDPALFALPFLGLGCGLSYIAAGYLMNRKKSAAKRSFEMLNLSGYNIGTFVIPFAQSFVGPAGVMTASIFDIGNAVICLGGSYSLAAMVKAGDGFSIRRIAKALVRSVPFMTYMVMLAMNFLRLPMPEFVLSAATIGSNANAFMAMLMIGVGFKLEANRAQLSALARLLAVRFFMGAVFALAFYFLLPFAVEVRQVLVILAFAPIGSAIPGFTEELGEDVGLSSALNSLSIVISIVLIVTLLTVML